MAETGYVYLVGAGPGDPGLITLKGLRCLQQADLILYDGLVNPLILRHTHSQAERTCRTMGPDGKRLDQVAINRRLIEEAQSGKVVVRLKGGDPYIFGRGAEEALALQEAGVPFEVVPGVTAATAAGAYGGLTFTHRACASAVAFVTGHEDPAKEHGMLDYRALAEFPGTLVYYMAFHRLSAIIAELLRHGKPPETPAAAICRATTPEQTTVTGTLADLQEKVDSTAMMPPSLIVIGDAVRWQELIAWYPQRPLFGKRIGITRPQEQAQTEIERCIALGAEPIPMPLITVGPVEDQRPIDESLNRIDQYQWLVFTSANGVRNLLDRLFALGGDARRLGHLRIAAIGPATADALAPYGLRADLVPSAYRAEALAAELLPHVTGNRVLWARASRGRDVLPRELAEVGAQLDELVVYMNEDIGELPRQQLEMIEQGQLDWVGLSSPSIARSFGTLISAKAREQLGKTVRLASISPVTSGVAEECGLPISAEAANYTWQGLFDAIIDAEN